MLEKLLKIVKSIDSCTTEEQLEGCAEMIAAFKKLDTEGLLTEDLKEYCNNKLESLSRVRLLTDKNYSIKIRPESENFKIPIKGTPEAACYDVYASKIEFANDGMATCYLGFSTEIPKGLKGVLVARSNITKYGWLLANGIGEIDSDFRNEWQARFRPIPTLDEFDKFSVYDQFPYKMGERVAQIYFEKALDINFELVTETSETVRGLGGFGHTGLQ